MALGVLLEEKAQQGLSVTGAIVREKAMWFIQSLHRVWGKETGSFCASKWWFKNFKQHISLQEMKSVGESASA